MLVTSQLDAQLLLFTALLFYLLFGYASLIKPGFQKDEYLKNIGTQIQTSVMGTKARAQFLKFSGLTEPEANTIHFYQNETASSIFETFVCALLLEDRLIIIWVICQIAISALVCAYLYSLYGAMGDQIKTSDLTMSQYCKIYAFPFVAVIFVSGSLVAINFVYPYCSSGAEQAVGGLHLGLFIIIVFLPIISKITLCCGCARAHNSSYVKKTK